MTKHPVAAFKPGIELTPSISIADSLAALLCQYILLEKKYFVKIKRFWIDKIDIITSMIMLKAAKLSWRSK